MGALQFSTHQAIMAFPIESHMSVSPEAISKPTQITIMIKSSTNLTDLPPLVGHWN